MRLNAKLENWKKNVWHKNDYWVTGEKSSKFF